MCDHPKKWDFTVNLDLSIPLLSFQMPSYKREFKLMDHSGHVAGSFTGNTPHQAALKAASRGHTEIMLREHFGNHQYEPKLHVFAGAKRRLRADEKTGFSASLGMKHKSHVAKIGSFPL